MFAAAPVRFDTLIVMYPEAVVDAFAPAMIKGAPADTVVDACT